MRGFLIASAIVAFSVVSVQAEPARNPTEAGIIDRYLSATQTQQSTMRGAHMEVDINANLPKLQKEGRLHALRSISYIGKITYRALGFTGDKSIKNDVIARYLSAEVQAQTGPSIAITPDNYKFRYKGEQLLDNHSIHVFQIAPRKKQVGLFKGELWLDADTCMPVRESGRFVKNPSIFFKKWEFTRIYEMQDGVSIPQHITSVVDTRIVGPVKVTVDFTHFEKNAPMTAETAEEALK